MGLALAVHVKGFGSWLRCSIHSWIVASNSMTLWRTPRWMRWPVISMNDSDVLLEMGLLNEQSLRFQLAESVS